MKVNTSPARGMRDLLPAQVEVRDHATAVILDTYRRFGFRRIETPAVEHIGLLTGSGGGDNEKLIYKILKRGTKLDLASAAGVDDLVDLGLRYDLTVPLARYYAAHQAELPRPFGAIQIGPVWRAERPQKGRYRQFTQCDIDVLGDDDPLVEAQLVEATVSALAALGLTGFRVRLNDRRVLLALAAACGFAPDAVPGVLVTVDKLDKLGLDGVGAELRANGHAEAAVAPLLTLLEGDPQDDEARRRLAPLVGDDAGAAAGLERLDVVRAALGGQLPGDARLVFDPTLVRGMGYYTGALFEIDLPGYGFSVAGGGRYDEMIGRMTGQPVPACGFSIGFERIVLVLEEQWGADGPRHAERRPRTALLYDRARHDLAEVLAAARALRGDEHLVAVFAGRKNRKQQLAELARHGFDGFVVHEPGAAPAVRELAPA